MIVTEIREEEDRLKSFYLSETYYMFRSKQPSSGTPSTKGFVKNSVYNKKDYN